VRVLFALDLYLLNIKGAHDSHISRRRCPATGAGAVLDATKTLQDFAPTGNLLFADGNYKTLVSGCAVRPRAQSRRGSRINFGSSGAREGG
jgi:hypothetical protein